MTINNHVPLVWLVEDSPADTALIEDMLFGECQVSTFVRISEICDSLQKKVPDIILLDLSLPDSVGLDGITSICNVNSWVPVVILTGYQDMDVALRAINEGAEDYLIKQKLEASMLLKTIRFAIERNNLKKDLLKANEELAQSKRKMEDLTYALTHDIRTPLSSLKVCLRILQDKEMGDKESARLLDIASRSMEQMNVTIGGFMEVLQVRERSNDHLEVVNIIEMWKELKQHHHDHSPEVSIKFQEKFEHSEVIFIPFAIRSILHNLLSNSIKYRRTEEELTISLSLSRDHNGTVLVFTDNGMGMNLDKVGARLFEPFSRFHTSLPIEGTGVGLYIIKSMMEANGGRFMVKSQEGAGTSFYLYFNENKGQPTVLGRHG